MIKTLEVVGVDATVNKSRRIRSPKNHGSYALMACVLEACDIDKLEYKHGRHGIMPWIMSVLLS